MIAAYTRSILLAVSVLCGSLASGQGKFTVNGRLKVEGSDLSGARAVLYKNGVRERAITTGLSKFSLVLDLNASYVIAFEKDGYVAKKLSFDTHVPADAVSNGFTPFDFAVSLFKQYDGINIVVFNQPVGMIRFDSGMGDFDYDTDYTKSIQSQLQEVITQVEKKQKEEAAAAVAEQKRKEEEARAQAKAQADAQKNAAAAQAAQAKAQADAEKNAAAAQAAQAKAQAEAEKNAAAAQAAQARAQAEAEKKAAADQAAQSRSQAETERAEKARLEATRKEEEKRKATEAAAKKEEPQPKPAPVVREEKPRPPPERPAPVRNSLASKPNTGEDGRRSTAPVMVEEASRVAPARTNTSEEQRPEELVDAPVIDRTEDLVVEGGKVTTIVKLESDGVVSEYRKVFHKWGGVFYFKNGESCTELVYDKETTQEQLAGATPRPKLD